MNIRRKNLHIGLIIGIAICLIISSVSLQSCSSKKDNNENKIGDKRASQTAKQKDNQADARIYVGVFDGFGGAQTCVWESYQACKLDPQMNVRYITSSDIAMGALDSLHAIIIPGGGGSRQFLNLGNENIERIREFVKEGGGAVGICAGAYLFSNTPNYSSMNLSGAKAIDLEHDNRGHGIAAFALTEQGKRLFPEYAHVDTLYCMYYEGPVYDTLDPPTYTTFATMLSDVCEESNAPSNMTNNRPFFIGNSYGKGRVFSSIAHPEATPGKMWMISRMVRWSVAKEDSFEQVINQNFKSPNLLQDNRLASREILMSVDDLKKESEYFKVLVYGEEEEKLEALDWLEAHYSWDAKRWIQGLVYDKSSAVRGRAAEYIANIHYLKYKKDVWAALQSEKDSATKERIQRAYDLLEKLY